MTNVKPDTPIERQFTGWHMLTVMVLFFGVIFGVNAFMAASAIGTWTGLVVENSYVASQEFNGKLANARAQDAMGWQGGFDYRDGEVVFTLVDGNGAPLAAEIVTADLSRPIGIAGDRTLTLVRAADGTYRAETALASGVWNAAIIATFDGQPDYEHRARLIVGGAK
jgi:nitrogen fixation protein FixH